MKTTSHRPAELKESDENGQMRRRTVRPMTHGDEDDNGIHRQLAWNRSGIIYLMTRLSSR